jgi:hypothetical protein
LGICFANGNCLIQKKKFKSYWIPILNIWTMAKATLIDYWPMHELKKHTRQNLERENEK